MMGAIVRGGLDEERVLQGVAAALGLDRARVGSLEAGDEADAVLVEAHVGTTGFRTHVTAHIDPGQVLLPQHDADFAARLARHFQQDALADPVGVAAVDSSYTWVLVRPGGEMFLAAELDTDGDGTEVDERPDRLRPLVTR